MGLFNTTLLLLATFSHKVFYVSSPSNVNVSEMHVCFKEEEDQSWKKMIEFTEQGRLEKYYKQENVSASNNLLLYKLRLLQENNTYWETPGWKVVSDYDNFGSMDAVNFKICLSNRILWIISIMIAIIVSTFFFTCFIVIVVYSNSASRIRIK